MSGPDPHELLSIAIQRENWEVAALCIVITAAQTLEILPAGEAEEMLEVLAGELEPRRPRRRKCRDRRR